MRRLPILCALAIATTLAGMGTATAQLKNLADTDPRAPKTGRTDDGLKADAEVDKLYRSKAGQATPNVKTDPWGDVRSPSAAAQPAKSKQKQP